MQPFADSLEHLQAELQRLDLLVRHGIDQMRGLARGDSGLPGLVITDREVDALLSRPVGMPHWAAAEDQTVPADVAAAVRHAADANAGRCAAATEQGVVLRLVELRRRFRLTAREVDLLLVAVAPDVDLRYERLYAYLQDDVTRKRPTVDLALSLLCPTLRSKVAARRLLAFDAPLVDRGLLRPLDASPDEPGSLLARVLHVDDRVVEYLLGADAPDARIAASLRAPDAAVSMDDLVLPDRLRQRVGRIRRCILGEAPPGAQGASPLLYLQGPAGVGKRAIASALCGEAGRGLLVVDGRKVLTDLDAQTAVRVSVREAHLQSAALYWDHFDALLSDEHEAGLDALLRAVRRRPGPVFLAGQRAWEPAGAFRDLAVTHVVVPKPTASERGRLWAMALPADGCAVQPEEVEAVASAYRLTGGQIRDAVAAARRRARLLDGDGAVVRAGDLHAASRQRSQRAMTTLGQVISPRRSSGDLVVPADRLAQLRDIRDHVRYRGLVYDEWGFDRRLSLAKGLGILFTGPPGTGKTLAAEVVAGELGLDLYKIDLSMVVSKYIGETEKNLSRVFAEAEESNVILFFDEADALFGKRSEVRDAHDRYANLEIGYLLQRTEEHEGVIILATNFSRNLDEAFVRRLQFAVEFPLPDEPARRRIWQLVWPEAAPLSDGVDLDLLARRFELSGGNIRNIALASAFLAARDGTDITMDHVLRVTQREYHKMGKVAVAGEFDEARR